MLKNMKNKFTLRFSLLTVASVLTASTAMAQMVGTDAYMKGTNVEIGISGLGGFEGAPTATAPVPAGMHYRSGTGYFGFVANPQLDSWANYDGDFFSPGTPENGWGYEVDSATGSRSNNCAYSQQINGAISYWNYTSPQTTCIWEADDTTGGTNLHFKINYELQDADLFYITTIAITNNTTSTIPSLYYYRNLDPDNNQSLSGDFTTENTILSQMDSGGVNTSVTATQTLPWLSSFTFLAVDSGWVAGYGGFSNRDATDMHYGSSYFVHSVGVANTADEAIFLTYKINNLAPAATSTFKFANLFASSAVASATNALNHVSAAGINDLSNTGNVTIYPNPLNDNATISIASTVQVKNAELHVYDMLGKEVASVLNIQTHQFSFQKDNLAGGLYIYKIVNNGQAIASGKLMIK
jgi:Secretion system C-terminal sorting domain